MNVVIKDRDTRKQIQLPLPIQQSVAVQFDEEGYVPMEIDLEKARLLAEVLVNASLSISQLNTLSRLVTKMDDTDQRRYIAAAAAFYTSFLGYPESFVVLAKAIGEVYIYPDCSNYIELGWLLNSSESHINNGAAFCNGLKFAKDNIVGFYDGAAVILCADAYNNAEHALSLDSDEDCSE